ncbi:MAG: LPS export ABC transporter periplasmic protein LptC [Pseudomonadota bacterium]
MAVADNRYSRFVQFVKIALPLLALGLLSTMFLLSRSVNPDGALTFYAGVEQIAREQQLAAPKFSGVTSDGSTVSVTAEFAKPDLSDPRRMTAVNVMADILTQSGTKISVNAKEALYDGNADALDLMGQVQVITSSGFRLDTEKLVADLAQTGLRAPGPVQGVTPSGTLAAGSMELTGTSDAQVLVFKDGVKLVYEPQD